VTRRSGVTTLVKRETALERGKGGDDTSWADTDLTRLKMKKIHTFDSTDINRQ
jgi:hypothetical protein